MSRKRTTEISYTEVFKTFMSFQNHSRYYSAPTTIFLWSRKMNATKPSFQPYTHNKKLWHMFKSSNEVSVLTTDWRTKVWVNTFLLNISVTLTSFFLTNSLDVPSTFKKVCALTQSFSSTTLTKLSSILMRHGKNRMISIKVSKALVALTCLQLPNIPFANSSLNWRLFFSVFTTLKFQTFFQRPKLQNLYCIDRYEQSFSLKVKKSYQFNLFSRTIYNLLRRYLPLFSFFIKKVSKRKWKHSRGRSGRYTIIWKYIPAYKRLTTLLRWLVNDIQFQKNHTLLNRIHSSIKNILISPSLHLISQFRAFVHKYVFQRSKNSLLTKLTTDS